MPPIFCYYVCLSTPLSYITRVIISNSFLNSVSRHSYRLKRQPQGEDEDLDDPIARSKSRELEHVAPAKV